MNRIFKHIQIRGAKTHNLKNIDVDIALDKITCLAGPSGSGKTSLAFHTLYQESKRRLINSFPSGIKFFWDIPQVADVDRIEPILPVWTLPQHNPVVGARPTLGDLMGLTERLQQIFFVLGSNHCPEHQCRYQKKEQWGHLLPPKRDPKLVLHILIKREDYKSKIRSSVTPMRSLNDRNKIQEFDENDLWWEIARLRVENFNTRMEEKMADLELERFHGNIRFFGRDGSIDLEKNIVANYSCPECGKEEGREITHFHHLSPYNGIGACAECDGHGMILKYDRKKLVKDSKLSIEDGAVSLMNYKSFQPWRQAMIRAFKREGFDLRQQFRKLALSKWKLLYEGDGDYPGFNSFFEYLESKRYKAHVRILIRSLKSEFLCPSCKGTRLSRYLDGFGIQLDTLLLWRDLAQVDLIELDRILKEILTKSKNQVLFSKMEKIALDIRETLETAIELGIGNLKVSTKVKGLSSGQYQRVLLSKLLSFRGSGSLFILDEPTLGLDENEVEKILYFLRKLRDQGNTILVIEHIPAMLEGVDEIIEMGPGAGEQGGTILYQGLPRKLEPPSIKFSLKTTFKDYLVVEGAPSSFDWTFDYQIPLRAISVVTGPSEAGKRQAVLETLERWGLGDKHAAGKIFCPLKFDKVISLTAGGSKITSRSSVGTFLGLINYLRQHFSQLPMSRSMGLEKGHFSYNTQGGRCSSCEGRGVMQIDMNFLEDVLMTCEDCRGMKLKPHYALISDGYQTYHRALNRPVEESFEHISMTAKAKRTLASLEALRLGHLSLDRALRSLSGGELQRIKLLGHTQGRMGPSLLIFENVSFGLSVTDLSALFVHLQHLRDCGHTLILLDQHPYLQNFVDYSLNIQ